MTSEAMEELGRSASESYRENALAVHVRAVLNAVRENRGPGRKMKRRHGLPSPDR